MIENKIIKLFTEGKVQTKEREFTKILGGFSETSPVITDKQIGELLGYAKGARAVRQRLENTNSEGKKNIDYFEFGIDILDLQRVPEKDTFAKALVSLGYAKQSITQAENIYIFSEAGFLLYLKFAEGEKAIELYKNFIELYFKTKAENIVMEKTLTESKQAMVEERKYILGSVLFETDTTKKMELLERDKKLEEQIKQIDITLAKDQLMEQVQDSLAIADRFTNSNKLYDVGEFSKILDIKGFGRNKLFEWMRDSKILMSNNSPYANQMEHFKIIAIDNNRFADSKTLIKSKGISYIVKKLIKDGKIQSKSYEDIIKNIDENLKVAN
jgi:phage antirepressor YoqD-like protein